MTRLSEAEGCALLKRVFEDRGYSIVENVAIPVGDAVVVLDGYDASTDVGYEYVTTEAGDREELGPAVLRELEASIARGDRHVLLVDELEVADAAMLERAAEGFLAEVGKRRAARAGGA